MASDAFIGMVFMFAGNFAPLGYMLCEGQLLPISQYAALFSILGTTYGGNGVSNFALPDLRGRVPLSFGQGPGLSNYSLGEAAGTENVTLLSNNMPQHNHLVNAVNTPGNATAPANTLFPAAPAVAVTHPSPDFPGIAIAGYSNATPNATLHQNTLGIAGGSVPHSNIQPYLALNFVIAITGVFPTRS